MHAHQPATCV